MPKGCHNQRKSKWAQKRPRSKKESERGAPGAKGVQAGSLQKGHSRAAPQQKLLTRDPKAESTQKGSPNQKGFKRPQCKKESKEDPTPNGTPKRPPLCTKIFHICLTALYSTYLYVQAEMHECVIMHISTSIHIYIYKPHANG